jgi:hypothetical protein
MSKVIFVLQRKDGTTPEECLDSWAGDDHIAFLSKLPGLTKWTQNHVRSAPGAPVCDGIGELWFESDDRWRRRSPRPRWSPPLRMPRASSIWSRRGSSSWRRTPSWGELRCVRVHPAETESAGDRGLRCSARKGR